MRILRGLSIFALCVTAAMSVPTPNDNAAAVRAVSTGIGEFSTNLYKTIAEKQTGNLIMSPLSVSVVLSMAAYGARQNTAAQMRSGLHMPEEESLSKPGYQGLIDDLNNVKDVELRLANKIYTDQGFSVKPDYKSLTETQFRSTSEAIDFSQADTAVKTINTWAEDQTNKRIKDLLKADDLNGAVMVLLNAVYFKGNWKVKFDAKETKDRPFHVDANTVKQVPTMYRRDDYKYGDLPELNATFVIIPYKGDELSMIIILPNEINGLPQLEKNLEKVNVPELVNKAYTREIKLYLPKFKIENTLQLEEPLTKLGMGEMFSDAADFSGMSDKPLKVGKVLQKAFIEVNEEGSEAAAVTEIGIALASLPLPPNVIEVNRPFIYAIIKKNPTAVLFQGHVVEPTV